MTSERRFPATAATHRSVLGVVRLIREAPAPVTLHQEPGDVRSELLRFDAALAHSREQLEGMRDERTTPEARDILDGQLLILGDPELIRGVLTHIKQDHWSALRSVDHVVNELCQRFSGMDDQYLAGREADMQDVGTRIRKNLIGVDPNEMVGIGATTVLVAESLAPSAVVLLESVPIGGIVMAGGAVTSHAAIMARGLNLPCLVGARGVMEAAENGDEILIDGREAQAILHPSPETRSALEARASDASEEMRTSLSPDGLRTVDGQRVYLRANISLGGEVRSLAAFGAEGVGLFRTEMLFMGRGRPPSFSSQLRAYKRVLQQAGGEVVTFRTIDAGGDKDLPFLQDHEDENPALGVRSIRLSLRERRVFRTQLRALLKAGPAGHMRLMYPMVTTFEELQEANAVLEEVKSELAAADEEHAGDLRAGIMVETPAAALMADSFAPEVAFFSIGTNDLLQFLFAADRGHPELQHLLDGVHPAAMEVIGRVVRAGREHGIPVAVCGELPADPVGFTVLLGLGIREFSMNLFAVPRAREIAARMDTRDLEAILGELHGARSAREVRERIQAHLDEVFEGASEA